MLDFETCRELKEHGFPQDKSDMKWYQQNYRDMLIGVPYYSEGAYDDHDDKICDCPTLSELISACGEKFYRITNCGECIVAEGDNYHSGQGSTFEEAVANLYLSLNPIK